MDKNNVQKMIDETFRTTEGNGAYIAESGRDITFFDDPLIGFSSASDYIYETFKEPQIIGPRFMTPEEWLPGAKTVISISFPFTEEVKASTRKCKRDPSIEWLYGRIEGHAFIQKFMRNLAQCFRQKGIRCCVPTEDERYARYPREYQSGDGLNRHFEIVWSERHAAFASGLGTFGLSRCLITKKGSAMRLISCIIDVELEPTPREYDDYMEYCTGCGACVGRCPVEAISFEYGKNNIVCSDWNYGLKERYYPRYGCSGSMTAVPCESGIPR